VLEDIGFQLRTQTFAAKRVAFARSRWWMPSLGTVRVEQARIPLTIDGSDTNPWSWATYHTSQTSVEPWQVPLEELSVDGTLVVQAAALPAQEIDGRPNYNLGPIKFASAIAMFWGIAGFLVGLIVVAAFAVLVAGGLTRPQSEQSRSIRSIPEHIR
jgi:hypothetical protein